MMLNRREFLAMSAASGFCASVAGGDVGWQAHPGRLRFAPHVGMFRHLAGEDPLDQIRFMADQEFAALDDAGLKDRPPALQERLGRELRRCGMTMGAFTAVADFDEPTFASGRIALAERVLKEIRTAVDVARRVGGRWLTVVPGKCDRRLATGQQRANAVGLLRRCADLCEPHGLVLLIEPVSAPGTDLLVRTAADAHRLCPAVGHPSCKLLFDAYGQRAAGEDVIGSLDALWDQVGYVQIGDFPGRKEPGTGLIDFRRFFNELRVRGYRGLIGMEHGQSQPGKAGEVAVMAAYRRV